MSDTSLIGRLTHPTTVTANPGHDNDSRAVQAMVPRISGYLHHCVKTPQCPSGEPCITCLSACRLVMNATIPLVADEIICLIQGHLGWRASRVYGGDD